jgi:aspartyl-tRNA(Asn)/glutamyl-tRNA(Gln) amidotransferase subunit A
VSAGLVDASLTGLSVARLQTALRAREASAVEVVEACLAGIGARDAALHAFATVTAEDALAAARAADVALATGRAGALTGVPVAVKDLVAVRGVVRTNGSAAFLGDRPAPADAPVVARLRAAGATIVGTTNLHELAYGPTGVNPALGTPVNPWAESRVPGGSSSGSGVAVAARLVPAALGTDTGGSIRVPASFCGIAGLKPTYGRVSRAGVTPLAWSLDHVGPMARTVEDLALLLQTVAGHDPTDPASARVAVPDYAAALDRPLRGVRIGVARHFCGAPIDREVSSTFEATLGDLRTEGAVVTDVVLPTLQLTSPMLGAVILAEARSALAPRVAQRLDAVGIETRVYLELGRVVTAGHYLAAQRLRTRLYEEMMAALRTVDVLATPATPLPAPNIGELSVRLGDEEVGALEAICRFTGPFNLTGLPALALPCGFTRAGLPVGLQLVGRPFAEADVLAAGHAYQRATDWHLRPPPT